MIRMPLSTNFTEPISLICLYSLLILRHAPEVAVPSCSVKNDSLKMLQILQKNTSDRVTFLIIRLILIKI